MVKRNQDRIITVKPVTGRRVKPRMRGHAMYKMSMMTPKETKQLKEQIVYLQSNYPYITDKEKQSKTREEIIRLKKALKEARVY